VQKTNEWLQEIMQELGTENRQQASVVLRATLHALRGRLPLEEMAHLGAQLPMLIRGTYHEGWSLWQKRALGVKDSLAVF
jgi:uncharacterized protein (DUF2267 family)